MKKGLSLLTKIFCVIAGICNIFLGFVCFAVFKDDKDIKHKEFANFMLYGAIIGIFVLIISLFIYVVNVNDGYFFVDYGYDEEYDEISNEEDYDYGEDEVVEDDSMGNYEE